MLVGATNETRSIRSPHHYRYRRDVNLKGVMKLPHGAMKETFNIKRLDATAECERPTQREVGRTHQAASSRDGRLSNRRT
jgi:hypothetical protein